MLVVDTHCDASPYWFEPIEVLPRISQIKLISLNM